MTTTDVVLEARARQETSDSLLRRDELPPLLLVAAITGVALIWNLFAGIRFNVSQALVVLGPMPCFLLFGWYRLVWPDEKIAEGALYLGLWLFYPAFGAELVYLVTTLNLPLTDRALLASDRALGFDWLGWAHFVLSHSWFKVASDLAYSSCFWQPVAGILLFAFRGPKFRNGEFLTSVMLGLLATILFYALLPNIGPADSLHINATGQIVLELRTGFKGPYSYVGITPFPSFHTVMAVLFTLAFRGRRWLFPAFGLLNVLMLTAVPFQGDHYLTDMIAGALIATAAFYAAQWIYGAIGDAGFPLSRE